MYMIAKAARRLRSENFYAGSACQFLPSTQDVFRVREPRPERRPPRPAPLVCEPFRLLCVRVLI
jgi:hypothetical protein